MNKVKIEDTEVFKQVAKVIGEKQAKIELFKASKSWTETDIEDVLLDCDLQLAFEWRDSSQGSFFWYKVDKGKSPYEQG